MLIRTFPLWFIKLLSVQLHTGVANDTALSSLLQFIKRINNSSTFTSQTFGFTLFRITRSATQACSDIDSRFHHWRMCGVKDFSLHCIHTVVDNFMAYHKIYSYQTYKFMYIYSYKVMHHNADKICKSCFLPRSHSMPSIHPHTCAS